MASEVDIANAALAVLGDTATVVSMYPPSGSTQAAHCARFYPMTRDTLLESHSWGFTTRRDSLALLAITPPSTWLYAYAAPTDSINFLAVLDPSALNDTVTGVAGFTGTYFSANNSSFGGVGYYTPQPYAAEAAPDGTTVIYSNQANAVLRYTKRITDPTEFSPLFVETFTWLLAAKLAGPVIKGVEGRAAAAACLKKYEYWFAKATESDANQTMDHPTGQTKWIQGRR